MCLRRDMLLRRLRPLLLVERRMDHRVGLRLVLVVLQLGMPRLRVQSLRMILRHHGLHPLLLVLGGTLPVSIRALELGWDWEIWGRKVLLYLDPGREGLGREERAWTVGEEAWMGPIVGTSRGHQWRIAYAGWMMVIGAEMRRVEWTMRRAE